MTTFQRLIPTYGNWGGPGWSAGRYNDDPSKTDWTVPGIDAMDDLFKLHDKTYQTEGMDRNLADRILVDGLLRLHPKDFGWRSNVYRYGAIAVFYVRYKFNEILDDL